MAKPISIQITGEYQDRDIKRAQKDLEKLQSQSMTMAGQMKASGEKLQAMGQKIGSVGKSMTLGLTLPIVGIGVAAGKMAMDFDTAMTKIVSLVGISSDEVAGMRESVLALSGATGKSAKELADALFVVTSAGLRGEAAVNALEASAKASAAGLGETADIARSVAGALNAYGPAALNAAQATDIIVATARAGNFETSQFAAALGRVLPFAKQAGASLEEVGGAVALLTRTNGDAAQSVTQVAALMRAFVVPTEEAKKALNAVGLSASDIRDRISKDGLASALQFLDKQLGGNREQLGKLLGSSEAAGAAFQILDADAQTLADTFGVVTDSAGMTNDAFNTTAQTAGFKTQQAFASLQSTLVGVGDVFLPLVATMAEKLSALANSFNELSPETKKLIIAGSAIVAAIGPMLLIVGKLIGAVGGLTTMFAGITVAGTILAAKVIAVVAVIAAMVAIFVWAYQNSESLRDAVSELVNTFKNVYNMIKNNVVGAFESMSDKTNESFSVFKIIGTYIKTYLTVYVSYLSTIIKALGAAFQVAMKVFEVGFTVLKMVGNIIKGAITLTIETLMNKLGPFSAAFRVFANAIGKAFGAVADFVKSAFQNIGKFVEGFINFGIDAINLLIRAYNLLAGIMPGMSRVTEIAEFKFQGLTTATNAAASSANNAANSIGGYASQVMRGNKAVDAGYNTNVQFASSLDDASLQADGFAGSVGSAGDAAEKSGNKAKEAGAKYRETFNSIHEQLTTQVEDIKKAMGDMATSVSSSLMRGFQLGDAAEEFGEDGARIGGTFMEKLQAQADKVTGFAEKIKELMALGLGINSPLMQAVIAEGAGSGTAIAQSLIDSGATGISDAEGMLTAAQGAADEIGLLAADNFYGAGLKSAEETVQAFVDKFGVQGKGRKRLMTLMDNLANAMKRETTITVTTINKVITENAKSLPARAMGGPVSARNAYLVGERGPEIFVPGNAGNIIPNDQIGSMTGRNAAGAGGGGGSTVINLNVNAGMGTDGAQVGEQIVSALRQYQRRNGALPITVA